MSRAIRQAELDIKVLALENAIIKVREELYKKFPDSDPESEEQRTLVAVSSLLVANVIIENDIEDLARDERYGLDLRDFPSYTSGYALGELVPLMRVTEAMTGTITKETGVNTNDL